MINTKPNNHGFALLLTLIVVSVVVALGLSLVEISLRQLNLSGVNRDSEIAFHAAYMGNECAEYSIRTRVGLSSFYTQSRPGGLVNNNVCVEGGTREHSYENDPLSLGETDVHRNRYKITWGPDASKRCTEIDIYVMDAVSSGGDITYNFSGDTGYKNKSCAEGRLCTLIFSRGYNRSCSDIGTGRTLQREVISEF